MTAQGTGPEAPSSDDVRRAAAAARTALIPLADADWSVAAGDLDMDARATLEHIIEGLAFYSRDLATPLASPPDEDEELVLRCEPGTPVPGLLDGMESVAAVIAAVVAATPAEIRAFHPMGMADRSGFAAMACDEILIHTDDITTGLGATFTPPAELCERVVTRLFPWAPEVADPWDRLRWANGRIALKDHPRLGPDWEWHCAPLDEWDGAPPWNR
jgi:hypothetical protein